MTTQNEPYSDWQKLCATHKNKIPCGESSQIDGLEAAKITFKDYHLICWTKVVFTKQLTNCDIHKLWVEQSFTLYMLNPHSGTPYCTKFQK